MASVIARVELHSAAREDYDTLHTAMTSEGFSRRVQADDGSWYQLPTGTYVHSSVGAAAGREKAARAAQTTGKKSSVFVGGWDGAWSGSDLDRA